MSDLPEREALAAALRLIVAHAPRLLSTCYWAGTAAIAIEETGHRRSFDLDFHTVSALQDVRPILAELEAAFGDRLQLVQPPDAFGSGFRAVLSTPDGSIPVEVLSNYEDVPETDLVESTTAAGLRRVGIARYAADKVQCIVERAEARDLVDLTAVLRARPRLEGYVRREMERQDALLLVERLLSWSDEALAADLAAYDDVEVSDAIEARERFLGWLGSNEESDE